MNVIICLNWVITNYYASQKLCNMPTYEIVVLHKVLSVETNYITYYKYITSFQMCSISTFSLIAGKSYFIYSKLSKNIVIIGNSQFYDCHPNLTRNKYFLRTMC